jgi:hypothetical protein
MMISTRLPRNNLDFLGERLFLPTFLAADHIDGINMEKLQLA